jgi:hypothetical protein
MTEVTVTMPLALTGEMLRAVRQHPTTSTDDKEEEHRRIGWLLCAWDVLKEKRLPPKLPEFKTASQAGLVAGDGQPCPNDHDPDCRWPNCNCRRIRNA